MSDTDRRLDICTRLGWFPVPYAHHPKPIRNAIRRAGFRPAMKQCFANCQRLFLDAPELDLEYHEGYITSIIPMPHAWLLWEGQRIDLTLRYDEDGIEYHGSTAYTRDEVRANMARTLQWCVMDDRALHLHHPHRKQFEFLERLQKELP